MAFAPTKPWKLPFITTWGDSPNRNLPTNSAEEAFLMSEQSEKKSPARAAAMAKVWAERRAWGMAPTCCCGCDQRLEIAKTPERQKYFKPGHDAALKSLLRKVLSGSVSREKIPEAARAN